MRYWWVNQNQTYDQEVSGGYLWSPKKKSNQARNYFYECMREVSPGDVIFSFKDTLIQAIGIAQSYCYECPKPVEFGAAGPNWNHIGWKVDVSYVPLNNKIKPASHMSALAPVLPKKYAPLQKTGSGLQGVYLTELPNALTQVLVGLIGREASDLVYGIRIAENLEDRTQTAATGLVEWEQYLTRQIEQDNSITDTERTALVIARRGQGRFKSNVSRLEKQCRVTMVDRTVHLRASHLKPWRDSSNDERLDGENGLLLTPTIDHLVDRGFISFENSGDLLISPVAHMPSLNRMGIVTDKSVNIGGFTEGQKYYMEYHRDNVFLQRR